MIGSGLKKYAQENGMKISHGVAYGNLMGYAASFSEGSGYKQLIISTKIVDQEQKDALTDAINQVNIQRMYRVQNLNILPSAIQIVFADNPGTMKKIQEFVSWFVSLLGQYGATRANICSECGGEITVGKWLLIDGAAFYMHDSCAEKVMQDIAQDNEVQKLESKGSYLTGTLGALLGATLGAVVWALVLLGGYVASLVGLLIGWLSEKGYTLLKGKQGKGKIAILILAVIFGVLLGTFAADVFTIIGMINDGSIETLTYGDIPGFLFMLLLNDSEYCSATVSNILMGLLFAGLGVFALLRKAGKDVAGTKVIELE